MTVRTPSPARPSAQPPRPAPAAARVGSLMRAEVLLLIRNRTTLFNAVVLVPVFIPIVAWSFGDLSGDTTAARHLGTILLMTLLTLAMVVVVYYNLTTTFVARREELVLKRLLTGQVTRAEVVLACATPAVLIMLAQVLLGVAATAVWFELPALANPVWLLIGLMGGTAVFVLLAVVSSGLTRTVESVQLTAMPVLLGATALSGAAVPLHILPPVVGQVAMWTPMYPVVALVQHGLGATALDGTVASGALADVTQPLVCLALWLALGVLGARRWMRWEPRR
ncbi:ABC transporter permease [Georgenia sp. SYP-B2076]|uniref:ABC transporter permease n=1 Tax=Georgenia sp. SYP-B2076 TaxID=2495881 RepID=UPI0013E0B9BD|nr:ABC transporter permease [Georgenia sp. SYP-B2076]